MRSESSCAILKSKKGGYDSYIAIAIRRQDRRFPDGLGGMHGVKKGRRRRTRILCDTGRGEVEDACVYHCCSWLAKNCCALHGITSA